MEACSGAHYWAREFEKFGHEVLLYPPQHVKNQRRKQKNDYNDAEAIAELALYQRTHPVPHKSIEQQDIQSLIRMRRLCVTERTRLINQVRGLIAEYGIIIPKGKTSFRQAIPEVLEDAENQLSPILRELLSRQYERYLYIDEQISWFEDKLNQTVKQFDNAKRLMSIPGFGPLTSQPSLYGSALDNNLKQGEMLLRRWDSFQNKTRRVAMSFFSVLPSGVILTFGLYWFMVLELL